jgi:hypothetical protein
LPSSTIASFRYSSLAYSISRQDVYQWGQPGDVPVPADFDGDGRSELAVFRPATGEWLVRYSSMPSSGAGVYQWGEPGDLPISLDFDGDGKTELTVFRPSTGGVVHPVFLVLVRRADYFQLGSAEDVPLPRQ